MKVNSLLKEVVLEKGIHEINFETIYPIGKIEGDYNDVTYFIGDEENKTTKYANKVKINVSKKTAIKIYLGAGYYVLYDEKMTNKFLYSSGWSGGDGIFSFNVTNGKDNIGLDEDINTLFVFGDTFVGKSDEKTNNRIEPHAMPNNSLAYMKNDKIEFFVNQNELNGIQAFYEMDPKFDTDGTIPYQLINELAKDKFGYISGYGGKDIYLIFDFHTSREIERVNIYNYFNEQMFDSRKRGFKEIKISYSDDNINFKHLKNYTLKISENTNFFEEVSLDIIARYIKIEVLSNYNDENYIEGLYGLSKIEFFNKDRKYLDIDIKTNSVYMEKRLNQWIWLQDGVVIDDKLYFIPIIITGDQSQPEGLQFRVCGAALFETKIVSEKLDFSTVKQKRAPLMLRKGTKEYLLGAGIFANTLQANTLNPDGYIYTYGFISEMGFRQLIVSRVLKDKFSLFDDWEYYSAGKWSKNLTDATPLLDHVSPELSVMELRDGPNKGKFMAVFTYDTNTTKVSFSIGESITGPFSKPQPIYLAKETEEFKSTTYTYNAKAHPHLSKANKLLASYNVNTYSFEHNMSDYKIYRPRFINIIHTID